MAARQRKGTFAFDLSHPIKKGVLLKQGAFHKAFKYRFFLVYPGFLVYYDQESRWLLDLTKGETLGGRLGAIKLKGGSCNVAKDAPKGCKFGFIVHAPDPVNKRPTYLISGTSKQDRDEWIEAIRKSTPSSPHQKRKNEETPKAPKEEPKKKEPEPISPHPKSPVRQDTAAAAAAVATENERLNGVDESISSIDESLPPTLDVRRDTASTAALLLTSKPNKDENEADTTSASTDENRDTSIDDLLGPQTPKSDKDSDASDEDGRQSTSRTNSNSSSGVPSASESPLPEATLVMENSDEVKTESEKTEQAKDGEKEENIGPEIEEVTDSQPMDLNETVESQTNINGNVEVVTSVTVECTGNGESDCDKDSAADAGESSATKVDSCEAQDTEKEAVSANDKDDTSSSPGNQPQEVEKDSSKVEEEDEEGVGSTSSEVLIPQEDRSNSFSINLSNIDTDDYSSTEDEETPQPPPISESPVKTSKEGDGEDEAPKANGDYPTITVDTVEGEKMKEDGQKEDGEGEKKERTSSDSSSGTEGEKLSASPDRRRSSQPFIEKKGFLYKMGGKRKNWNLRYFVLRPGVFTYAKNPSTKTLGEVKLKNLQVFFPGAGERKTSFQFTIHTESSWNKRSDWVLAAQSEREMKDWILAFKLAGQKNITPAASDNELDST